MRRARISGAVVVALTGAAVLVARPATATTTGSFDCTQTSSGRRLNVQEVTGRIAADGSPTNVYVTRPFNESWRVDFGPVANPPRATGVSWAGYDVYDVSDVPNPPPLSRRGLFGIPHNPPGITGPTFTARLVTQLTGGGSWTKTMSCTLS
jgi:hypothetical protein